MQKNLLYIFDLAITATTNTVKLLMNGENKPPMADFFLFASPPQKDLIQLHP